MSRCGEFSAGGQYKQAFFVGDITVTNQQTFEGFNLYGWLDMHRLAVGAHLSNDSYRLFAWLGRREGLNGLVSLGRQGYEVQCSVEVGAVLQAKLTYCKTGGGGDGLRVGLKGSLYA